MENDGYLKHMADRAGYKYKYVGNKPAFGKMGKNAEPLLANDCSMCKQST
jgi:hypothetical protein